MAVDRGGRGRADRGRASRRRGGGPAGGGGEEELDAAGCALLPGLHDHHVHLRALAAAQASVQVGPEQVRSAAELAARLRAADAAAPAGAWLRCVGYHESVAGPLDRWVLDRLADLTRPVRVQHRTGALWVVNSAGMALLGLEPTARRGTWPGWSATMTAGRPGDCGGWTGGSATGFPRGRAMPPSAWPRSAFGRPRSASPASPTPPPARPGVTSPAWRRRWRTGRSRSGCTAWRPPMMAVPAPCPAARAAAQHRAGQDHARR